MGIRKKLIVPICVCLVALGVYYAIPTLPSYMTGDDYSFKELAILRFFSIMNPLILSIVCFALLYYQSPLLYSLEIRRLLQYFESSPKPPELPLLLEIFYFRFIIQSSPNP